MARGQTCVWRSTRLKQCVGVIDRMSYSLPRPINKPFALCLGVVESGVCWPEEIVSEHYSLEGAVAAAIAWMELHPVEQELALKALAL